MRNIAARRSKEADAAASERVRLVQLLLGLTPIYNGSMRMTLLAALVGIFASGSAMADESGRCESMSRDDATVTGVVREIGTIQEEPNVEPTTSFFLDDADSICANRALFVFAIGHLPCVDGDIARVVGHYSAPSDLFPQPMIDALRVQCRSGRNSWPDAP